MPTYGYGFEVGYGAGTLVAFLMSAVLSCFAYPWYGYVLIALIGLAISTFKALREVKRAEQFE